METATWVLTCKYWFSMSRITCLIILSGSSAWSIMSFRFARIRVLTRSRSPMMILLSDCDKPFTSRATTQNRGSPEKKRLQTKQEPRESTEGREPERKTIFQCHLRVSGKLRDQKLHYHHREYPQDQKDFSHGHGLFPQRQKKALGRPRPAPAEAVVTHCSAQAATRALALCRR